MGVWGSAPWDSDTAADWFSEFFEGVDVAQRIGDALQYDDDYDKIRAACYLLATLGRTYVWPGDLDRLDELLEQGIELLTEMLEPDSEFLELWEDEPEVIEAVRAELAELEDRLNGDGDEDDDEDDDEEADDGDDDEDDGDDEADDEDEDDEDDNEEDAADDEE